MPLSAEMPAPVRTATDCAATSRSRACSNSDMVLQGLSDEADGFGRVRPVHAEHRDIFANRPPAREHSQGSESGEDADQRHAAGGGHMLSGGIVSDVETAGGNHRCEAGKGAFP